MKVLILKISFLILIFCICTNISALAQKHTSVWHIYANKITYFQTTHTISAIGNVTAIQKDILIRAEKITYIEKDKLLIANGNLTITTPNNILKGDSATVNVKNKTGTIKNAWLFIRKNNVYIKADTIKKLGANSYFAKNAVITTCKGNIPDWSFKCSRLNLTLDGMAWAINDTFRIKNIPILYTPIIGLPVNRHRKTGFLFPYYSSSNKNGIEVNLPFFWAITEYMDATFYQHPMSKRGWMQGIEFRYCLSKKDKGIIRYNFIHDKAKSFPNTYSRSRWWLRAKANQQLPFKIQSKLDIDIVSDKDFIEDFNSGPMGYDKTKQIFLHEFSRGLVDKNSIVRPSTLEFTRAFDEYFTGAELRYNYNLISQDRDSTIQVLPYIYGISFTKRLNNYPMFYGAQISYVNYYRKQGINYQRINFIPKILIPINLWNTAILTFKTNIDDSLYSVYNLDNNSNSSNSNIRRYSNRLVPEFNVDLSTNINKIYNNTYLHTIEPHIGYVYRPQINQSYIPQIDALDYLQKENKIYAKLVSYITKKSLIDGSNKFDDIFRLEVTGSYDINEATRHLTSGERRHPFSDIYTTIDFKPIKYINTRYDMTYSVYGYGITNENFRGNFSTPFGQHLNINFIYNHLTGQRTLSLSCSTPLIYGFSASYSTNRNLKLGTEISSTYGLTYNGGCWSIVATLTKNQEETRWLVRIILTGLGGVGIK